MPSVVEFVALGPGGSHLVTARALAALQAVQHIYYPELGGKSQARELLVQLGLSGEKLRGYILPMSHNRQAALEAYAQVAREVAELARQEHSIAIVAEGDVSIYSSTHYIATQLEARGLSIRHHAGIPSFIAAASALNISLVEGNEMLVVSPGKVSRELLQSVADGGSTLVIMKLSQCEAELKALMPHFAPYLQYYYCEFVERPNALYLRDLEAIQVHPFTYFSLLICKSHPSPTNR